MKKLLFLMAILTSFSGYAVTNSYTISPLDCTQNVDICSKFGVSLTDWNGDVATGWYVSGGKSIAYYGSTTIYYPGAWNNRAEGVNAYGVVAGWSQVRTRPLLGFRSPLKTIGWLWSAERGFFKEFPGFQIADINDNEIVLSSAPAATFDANGVKSLLPIMPNTFGTWLYELDNFGNIYGIVRTSSTSYIYSNIIYLKN